MMESKITCKACRKGVLHPSTSLRTYKPNSKDVQVELLTSKCDHCGELTTFAAQHIENLKRLAARKPHYDGVLMGEEYLSLRKKYGLTQQLASKIFGKGIIAFSRYENEETYPDKTTSLLIETAIERPDILKRLADKAGVEIPLWKERCEDEQRIKVRLLPVKAAALPDVVVRQDITYKAAGSASPRSSSVPWPKVWRRVSHFGAERTSQAQLCDLEVAV